MTNYQDGKIYEIVCGTTKKRYIGSTCEKYLSSRLQGHVRMFKLFQQGKHHFVSVYEIIEKNNYYINLVEKYPCSSKNELLTRERYWINQMECINLTKRPIVSEEEKKEYKAKWFQENYEIVYAPILIKMFEDPEEKAEKEEQKRQANIEYLRQWKANLSDEQIEQQKENKKRHYEQNKEKVKQRVKEYAQANAEKVKQKKKEYYEKNKGSEKSKQQYEKRKERLREKVECPHCKQERVRASLARHIKTFHKE